jgi:hypothetical protein
MARGSRVAGAALLVLLGVAPLVGASGHGHGGKIKVGAASRSVLPLVNGSTDYLAAGFPARSDPFSPGILVPAWDDGRIAVGNGNAESYWVHDDLRVTAVAFQKKKQIVVIVSADLYMVFRLDAEEIRAKAAALLGKKLAKKTQILVAATHDHHGPDTAFDVNHAWYEHMTDQVAAAVAEAVANRKKATLRVAAGEHWFGMDDGTDPQVFDPALNVLQAVGKKGDVIATLVQWNDHPETTLGFSPPQDQIAADCITLGLVGPDCDAEGRYFSADYPGIVRQDLQARYGGEVAYLNGALGVIIGPGGSDVWEVTADHPLGNQLVAPAGASPVDGAASFTEKNFRRTVVVGEQVAAAAIRLLDTAQTIEKPTLSYAVQPFYTRLSNIGFRVLLVVDPVTGRSALGHNIATLYNCPALGPKTDANCIPDGLAKIDDANLGVSYRVGDHVKTAVEYVRIGPVGILFLPGEIPGELTVGLPSGFRSSPGEWYDEPLGTHAFGDDYHTPGYAKRRMSDTYRWTVGLGSDELGYVIPISNFRVLCAGDEFAPGACDAMYANGVMEFPDSVAGATCKAVTEDPSLLTGYPVPYGALLSASCQFGQGLGEANGHYEETNSAGWDLAQDVLDAVGALTGSSDATEVNPDFPGWHQNHLPPGDLP